MKFAFSLGACALLLMAGTATAQDRTSRSVRGLMDADLTQDGRTLGRVSDVTLTDGGAVRDLIVSTGNGQVAVPYSAVRYDDRARGYVVATGIKPRPHGEARAAAREPAPTSDRYSRGARLERDEEPPARIERTPRTHEYSSARLASLAWAAQTYSEPTGSVSMTRNVDRLPPRSATVSNETLASEHYGWRKPYYRQTQPAPIAYSTTSALSGR
jgi:hypothetical protein